MSRPEDHKIMAKPPKKPMEPRPSASVMVVSPKNEILLLHRVQTSTSFPSAHVFPGGNLSAQDGLVPGPDNPEERHRDSPPYRHGAIRECFEESGILLARENGKESLLYLNDEDREKARRAIHGRKAQFRPWVEEKGGKPDLDGLLPFTRWVTPTNVPKRFTTQMYLYFLPLSAQEAGSPAGLGSLEKGETLIPIPTSDGGIEHTAAKFLRPRKWLEMARSAEIILFPPQFMLLTLSGKFLDRPGDDMATLEKNRQDLISFVNSGQPSWKDKCISPRGILFRKQDGRAVLALDSPGPELVAAGSSRKGDADRVILVKTSKAGPVDVEVAWRQQVMQGETIDENAEAKRLKQRAEMMKALMEKGRKAAKI